MAHQPRFSDIFDSMLDRGYDFSKQANSGLKPGTNILENDSTYILEFAVPGLKKSDFKVNLENNVLTVSAEIEENKETEVLNYSRKEFTVASFSRTFTVPKTVNADDVKADYKNGILTVKLPKKEEVRITKEIKIS